MMSNLTCTISTDLTSNGVFFYGISTRMAVNGFGAMGNLVFAAILASMSVLDTTVKCILINLSGSLAVYGLTTALFIVHSMIHALKGDECPLVVD